MTSSATLPTTELTSTDTEQPSTAQAFDADSFDEKISILTQFIAAEDPEISIEKKGRLRAQLKIASDKLERLPTETKDTGVIDEESASDTEEKTPISLMGRREVFDFLSTKDINFNNYAITVNAADHTQEHKRFSQELALAPLIFSYPKKTNTEKEKYISRKNAEDLFSFCKIKRFSKLEEPLARAALDSIEVFDVGSAITLKGKSVEVSYGNFTGFEIINRGMFEASPLMVEYVQERLSTTLGELNNLQKNHIHKNLSLLADGTFCKERCNNVWWFLASIPDAWPEETVQSIGEHLQLLRRFFLMCVMPVVLLEPGLKPYVRSSFLKTGLGNEDDILALIEECFIKFASQYEPICKAIEIARKQTTFMAELDLNGVAQKKSAPLIPNVFEPVKRAVGFRVSKQLPEEGGQEVVDLIGKVMESKALEKLFALGSRHPHFSAVVDYLEPYVKVSYLTGRPFKFPPLLIAGPPGIGKSKFMDELYDVFGYPRRILHGSEVTHGASIAGLQQTWGTAHQGYVAETMLQTELINPLITFDELDKTGAFRDEQTTINSALLRVLEPLEAKNFRDAFFNTPHDISAVNWIFTCNQPRTISNALMTRMTTIYVYPPTERSAIDHVHNSIWLDQIKGYGAEEMVSTVIDKDILDHLTEVYYDELQFRASYRLLERGMTKILASVRPGQKSMLTLDMMVKKKAAGEPRTGIVLH